MANYLSYVGKELSESIAKTLFPGEWILGEAVRMGKKDLIVKILAVSENRSGLKHLYNDMLAKYPNRRLVIFKGN